MSAPINVPAPLFRLTPAERQSDAWRRLEKHLTDRLQSLRVQNDGDNSYEATAKLRGRIAELKAMLALAQDIPIQPPGQ